LVEESISAAVPFMRQEIIRAASDAEENSVLNGRKTGVLDSDVVNANDVRHAWDGVRQFATGAALGNNLAVFAPATAGRIEIGDLRKLRSKMGRYAVN